MIVGLYNFLQWTTNPTSVHTQRFHKADTTIIHPWGNTLMSSYCYSSLLVGNIPIMQLQHRTYPLLLTAIIKYHNEWLLYTSEFKISWFSHFWLTKFYSKNFFLKCMACTYVDEEVSVLGTNNSQEDSRNFITKIFYPQGKMVWISDHRNLELISLTYTGNIWRGKLWWRWTIQVKAIGKEKFGEQATVSAYQCCFSMGISF